jgi:hypothetical protein
MLSLAALLALLAPALALAQTCKYVDSEGRVTYSNVPVRDARKVSCFEAPAAAPQASDASKESAPPAKARVEPTAQRQRDDQRRSILQSELAAEEGRLAEAKRALAEQEAIRQGDERNYQRVLDRLKPYQETVEQHEKNIAALKQEMANLR